MKSTVPMPVGRKKMFRATVGMTIDQQLQMASQLQAQGDDVLKTIHKIKKTSGYQRETTKSNTLKFEWLQEHSRLKKLEENCSKELESLLLRMYNEAFSTQDSKKWLQSKKSAAMDNQQQNEIKSHVDTSQASTMLGSTSTAYAAELDEIIRTEQLNRVALMNQVSSEREQRAALSQFLVAVSHEQDTDAQSKTYNRHLPEYLQTNVRQLIYDAIIGRQMIEVALEEEVKSCENDFNVAYQNVLNTLQNETRISVNKSSNQDHEITELYEAAGGNKLSDEMVRLEVFKEFQNLFTQFREDLDQYKQDFISAASADTAAGSIEAASSRNGGWSDIDEERFLSAFYNHDKKAGAGKKLELLYDQVALALPSISLDEIKKHMKFHQHFRFFQQKRKDRRREFQRRLEEQQSLASIKIRKAIGKEKEKTRKLKQLQEMREQCNLQRDHVSQWRVTKEAKERIERQQHEIKQMLDDQKQQEEGFLLRRRQNQHKLAVDDYKKDKILRQLADDKLALEKEQNRHEEQALQRVVDTERVQFRHHAFQRKLDDMKQQELHKVQLKAQRLSKLNALKEETPYAQIIANIAPDAERTRQETAAFRANINAAQEGSSITETGLFPSNGYDCDTLFKNARFKLGIALRNAGLNSSEFACQALANVKVCNVGAYRNHIAEPTKLW